ncbi:hypothetical protein [Mesorhizobium sp. M0847]|uniref:hypothetical protein n=1 Tax=unclassified Mesorhizobium TaxID=325217 RepID=UPI003334E5FB
MNVQNILKSLRGGQTSTADQLRQTLDQIDIEGLEAAAEKLEADRRRVLLDGTDKDLEAIETKIAAANRDIERAYAAKAELERRLEAAAITETQQERTVKYDAAKAQADAAAKLLATKYPAIGREFVALLKTLAEAQLAVDLANHNLPDGAVPLVDPEFAMRGRPGQPEKTLKEERVTLWCYDSPGIQVMPPDKQDEMNRRHPGEDVGSVQGQRRAYRRRLIRRTYVPWQSPQRPVGLATIEIPALKIGDPPIFASPSFSDARSVLAKLAQIAEMRPAPEINTADIIVEYLDAAEADVSSKNEEAA